MNTKQELEEQAKKKQQEYLNILEQIKELDNKDKKQFFCSGTFSIFKKLFDDGVLQKLNIGFSGKDYLYGSITSYNEILQFINETIIRILYVYKSSNIIDDCYIDNHRHECYASSLSVYKYSKYAYPSYRPIINYIDGW